MTFVAVRTGIQGAHGLQGALGIQLRPELLPAEQGCSPTPRSATTTVCDMRDHVVTAVLPDSRSAYNEGH